MSNEVVIYSSRFCGFCMRAKHLLAGKGVEYREISVDGNRQLREEMTRRAGGRRTVPQIWIGDQHVGGSDELVALERRDELDMLLKEKGIAFNG